MFEFASVFPPAGTVLIYISGAIAAVIAILIILMFLVAAILILTLTPILIFDGITGLFGIKPIIKISRSSCGFPVRII